ncbi:unnamed protein product [Didymodactylos carnosus]|uniref:Uncharacterized protein n=1 Tax=Didymodactylos carnosus TaxID=1234261 RepID=A0A814UR84_9BILA|nr:unnamed protein product [Didymodactylos carnosus]CAF3943518.1 unnamed protein product [Didymodactylos carnosus]
MTFIPNGGDLLHSILADSVCKCLSKYTSYYAGVPDPVYLECQLSRWFCSMFGFENAVSSGIFTTGGSSSNLSSV